jgi:hypothetical protein
MALVEQMGAAASLKSAALSVLPTWCTPLSYEGSGIAPSTQA